MKRYMDITLEELIEEQFNRVYIMEEIKSEYGSN